MIKTSIRRFTLPAAFRETREILSTENWFRFVFMGFSLVYFHRKKFVIYSDIVSLSDDTRLVFSPFRFSTLTWERGASKSSSEIYKLFSDGCVHRGFYCCKCGNFHSVRSSIVQSSNRNQCMWFLT